MCSNMHPNVTQEQALDISYTLIPSDCTTPDRVSQTRSNCEAMPLHSEHTLSWKSIRAVCRGTSNCSTYLTFTSPGEKSGARSGNACTWRIHVDKRPPSSQTWNVQADLHILGWGHSRRLARLAARRRSQLEANQAATEL